MAKFDQTMEDKTMHKKKHPILFLCSIAILAGFLWLNGSFDTSILTESEDEEKSEVVQTMHVHAAETTKLENTKPATCESDGSCDSVVYCSCGEEMSREKTTLPAIGHNYRKKVTEATCVQSGITTYTCNNCGSTYKDNYKEASGHNYIEGVCSKCDMKDENYVKEYSSAELLEELNTSLVNGSNGLEFCEDGETISVFAEDHQDALAFSMGVFYNLLGKNKQEATFNVRQLKNMAPTLFYHVGGETGSNGLVHVEIYLDNIEDDNPNYSLDIECNDVPQKMAVDISEAELMRIKVTNTSGNNNKLVFYDFSNLDTI